MSNIERLLNWIATNKGAHPENVARVASEALAALKEQNPFGYVAIYCGEKLFLDTKDAADFYTQCCEVVPVYARASATELSDDR